MSSLWKGWCMDDQKWQSLNICHNNKTTFLCIKYYHEGVTVIQLIKIDESTLVPIIKR